MKDNFDDIIRRRWEEQVFPVDEVHRREMAKLLGARRRRGLIFWWFGGLALAVSVALLLWTNPIPPTQNPSASGHVRTQSETPHQEVTSNQPESKLNDDPAYSSTADQSQHAQKPNFTPIPSKTKPSKTTPQFKITTPSTQLSTPDHDQVDAGLIEAQDESTNQSTTHGENPAESKVALTEEKSDPFYQVELENPNQATFLSNKATIRVFPDSIEYDPWTNEIFHNGTKRSLNITKQVDALDLGEIEFESHRGPQGITPRTKLVHPIYFLAETGLGFVLAAKPEYTAGTKFSLGGGLGYQVIPRVHLQLTGGYRMQDGGFNFERTSTVKRLDFGVRSEFNRLTPDRLHFVYSRLGLAYRLGRSSLGTHIGAQWLYGAQGTITIVHQNQFTSIDPESKYAWVSTDGLRKLQWWSDVSYGYMIFPKLYLQGGVEMYYTSLTASDAALQQEGYYWTGKTASFQPFITLNYLLHAKF